MIVSDIIDKIKSSKKIAITFHVSPDGDSIGASLGFLYGLRTIKEDVSILCKEKLPEAFSFLPNASEITGENAAISQDTDLLITLDCGDIERLNYEKDDESFKNRDYFVINIDHHLTNKSFGDINYVDTKASSVGEIVYCILKEMHVNINQEIAACLYTSILTDTGSFRHSNTTSATHSIAGELISTGIDFSEIHRRIFDNKKFEALKLQALVLNGMYLTCNKRLCVMKVTKAMIDETGADETDTGDLVSIGLKVDTAEVCVLLKEKDNVVKLSLRSKSNVDVRKIAEKFDGGGHTKAAGLAMEKSIKEAEEIIVSEIEKELI
ncbi:bifunctional oligoribonuclease/PAP phosphatase NrnA [Clostridium neuense]|uniref:Bifunctional oligoribonuclease/PAP phosphatase NrnA n=1 Tax=Clostridium neuense TaxID=1728934 RepID=A0ABW8TBE5_9CLOT